MLDWLEGKKTMVVSVFAMVGGLLQAVGVWEVVPEWMSEGAVVAMMGGVMAVLRWVTSTPVFQKKEK